MKHNPLLIFILLALFACKSKNRVEVLNYSQIAILTLQAENQHVDQELREISNVSVLAKDYIKYLPVLDAKATELKQAFRKDNSILGSYQKGLIDSFANSLKFISKTDSITLSLLKETPITSEQDIDQLLLFMKRTYFKNASYGERYYFNILSTTYSFDKSNMNRGEEVSLNLNITAANTNTPAEWFILKDGGKPLTTENISDTLHPDEYGNVKFKRKILKSGENWIEFATKIPSTQGEVVLYKTAVFDVH